MEGGGAGELEVVVDETRLVGGKTEEDGVDAVWGGGVVGEGEGEVGEGGDGGAEDVC